jgi:hypothetical protein
MNKKQLTISLIGIATTCSSVGFENEKVLANEILTESSIEIERQENTSDRNFVFSTRILNLQNNPEYLYLADVKIREFGCDSLDGFDRSSSFCSSDRTDSLTQQPIESFPQLAVRRWGAVADASTLGVGGAIVAALSPNLLVLLLITALLPKIARSLEMKSIEHSIEKEAIFKVNSRILKFIP